MATTMQTDPFDLTAFQRDLLSTVATDANGETGIAIREAYEAQFKTDVNHGRLYPNLDTLVDAGYLKKTHPDRRSNAYHITPAGERARAAYENHHADTGEGPEGADQ
jgi:DNA-binding PadR family transcriptional regulator